MFALPLDRFSSHLANSNPFLNDIIERALTILNHKQFQHNVLNELCAKVVKTRSSDCENLQQFVQDGCSRLRIEVCVQMLDVPGVLMQCEASSYDENKSYIIFINQSWYKHILEIERNEKEYYFHVVLGLIKLIHEVCHCCTGVFCAFSSIINPEKKKIKVTPSSIGRKIVQTSPSHSASSSKRKSRHGTPRSNREKKSTREIGDMGFGGEELLLGGQLFPIMDEEQKNQFKFMGLRVDVHDGSSIPTRKVALDFNFINQFFDLNQLKSIENFDNFKVPFNRLVDVNQMTESSSSQVTPIRGKRQKLKRAESESSLSSSSSASASSTHLDNLFNIDPKDPNVLYPPFYIPPPGFVPRSPNSSEDDDYTDEPYRVNGMPLNFRE